MQHERRITPPMFYRWQLAVRPKAQLRDGTKHHRSLPHGTHVALIEEWLGHKPGTHMIVLAELMSTLQGTPAYNVCLCNNHYKQLCVPKKLLKLRMVPGALANEHLFRAGRLLQQYVATQVTLITDILTYSHAYQAHLQNALT